MRRQDRRQRTLWAVLGTAWIVLIAAGALAPLAAQTLVGQISGTVTDASKAVLPGATVTIVNVQTQISRTATTDERGAYIITNLPPGTYNVTAELQGFRKAERTGFNLAADGRLTADFALPVGEVTETVEVASVVGETVNRTSGEIARVIDSKQVLTTALNVRNYMQLAALIPGSALTDYNPLVATTGINSATQSINGNRSQTNNISVDGVYNLVAGSNASQISNVGLDFIDQIKLQTSNFSAEYGRNSGASINVVTKSGSNAYHGSLFEYLRNDKFDATDFFAAKKPTLRFNDYGGSVGGPIEKSKLFFYGGIEYKKIRQQVVQRATIPDTAFRNGDFSALLPNIQLMYPGTKTPIPNNNISSMITPEGKAIANLYSAMQQRGTAYTDSNVGNNVTFQEANPFNWYEVFGRVDYHISDTQNFYYRLLYDDYDLIDPFGAFLSSPLPNVPTNRLRPSPNHQISYTWFVNPNFITETKASAAWAAQRVPPVGDLWQRDTYGFNFPQLFNGGGRFDNSIPDATITNFSGWNGAARSLLSPTTDINVAETVTWLHGAHTVKSGVTLVRSRIDQNGRSTYAGNVAYNPTGNSNTTGYAFADALLGNFRTYSEANGDPMGFFRIWQVDSFVTDNWRIGSKLSLDAGVRFTWEPAMYTQMNNATNFDPSLYDPSQAVTMTQGGTIAPNSPGNRYNGLIRAGNGVPSSDQGRVPGFDSPAVLAVPTGAPRGLYSKSFGVAPRVGVAWTPTDSGKTSVRGGFGIFFDRPEGNIYFPSINNPPFLQTVQYDNGNLANPGAGAPTTSAPFGTVAAIDPNMDIPRTYQFSASVQRELMKGFFVEASYVGNRGRDLIFYPDINQVPFDVLAANAALPSAQRFTTNALRPYKGYSVIQQRQSKAVINYNGLQLYATKRQGDLTLTASYTLSKALTNASGIGDNPEDPFNPNFNYGPASFDRRHVAVFTYTYSLPFFRDKGGVLEGTLGGWEVSGITRFQTGQYYSVTADTLIGNRRADLVGTIDLPSNQRTSNAWFNTAAFVAAPDNRRGNAPTGDVLGPSLKLWDLSLRKHIPVGKTINALFTADFFNAFNVVNLTGLNVNMANAAFGSVTGSAPARNIQLGLKFTF